LILATLTGYLFWLDVQTDSTKINSPFFDSGSMLIVFSTDSFWLGPITPSINKTIKDRGILIVKDVPGSQRNDIPGLIGMNVISQCAELLQKQKGPSYLKQIKCDETMVNCLL
jgi:hypothetical protein